MQVTDPYLLNLMLDVKNLRVKHVRKMFVLLRELGTELKLAELQDKKDWSSFQELNQKLDLLVVEHGITLGEFATGYVFNIQSRQREPVSVPKVKETTGTKKETTVTPKPPPVETPKNTSRKRKTENQDQPSEKKRKRINK